MSRSAHQLLIVSDQFTRDLIGCYGGKVLRTPNLDRLAARGVCYERAYTNCPICVPARASLATGRYVHQIRHWDNGLPYDGSTRGWAHRLNDAGVRIDSIGKLHFRREGDAGFTREHRPLHVVDGVGDALSCVRDDPPPRPKREQILSAGPGDSSYLRYDRWIATATCDWLAERAGRTEPWALMTSFVCPHPPYIGPRAFFDHYRAHPLPKPPQSREEDWPAHPALHYLRAMFDWTTPFTETELHNVAAAYYAAAEAVDAHVGRILDALETHGLTDTTDIIFCSDHGESLGARGVFGKFTMYEESVAVPLIAAGPSYPRRTRTRTPVTLLDIHATMLDAFGLDDPDTPGKPLARFANAPDQPRIAFSEYHAVHSRHGVFMVCDGRHKLVHYVHEPCQLFDLHTDPQEVRNLADDPAFSAVRSRLDRELLAIVDPEATDRMAKTDQAARVKALGGRDAVLARGHFIDSPIPGEKAAFHRSVSRTKRNSQAATTGPG